MLTSIAPNRAGEISATTDVPAPPLDEPALQALADAVVYDWDLTTDALAWGANARQVFKDLPLEALSSGAAFAQWQIRAGGPSRAALFIGAKPDDAGEGAPYQSTFALRSPAGARLQVSDIGRWSADASGRPVWAHGLLRVQNVQREPNFAPTAAATRRNGRVKRAELLAAIDSRARAERFAAGGFAVAAIGVDRLDEFNEQWGFQASEELLDAVSARIANMLRASDAFARHAGANFVAQLALGDKDLAQTTAARLAERLNRGPYRLRGLAADAKVRVGLAMATNSADGAETLIRRAVDALEHARAQGAPSCCFDESEARDLRRRLEADDLKRLDRAIAMGAFALVYQPILALSAGSPAIHEASARLVDADRLAAQGGGWLHLAERHGRIEAIDQMVLQAALAQLIANPALTIAARIAPGALRDPVFVALLRGALRGRPRIARRLIVEIAESAAIQAGDAVAANLAELRAAGVRFALLGFGAGHACWRQLRALKPDVVKLDGAFVQNIARSSDDRFFVRELIALARRIGAKTVAEWVGDAETLSLLGKWGCDYAQGPYVGAPAFDLAWEQSGELAAELAAG